MISFYSYNCISRYESNKIIFTIIYFIIIIIYLLNLNFYFFYFYFSFLSNHLHKNSNLHHLQIIKSSLNQFNISILLLFYLIYVSKKIATKLRQVNKIILYFYISCLSMLWNRYSCICQQNVHASGEWQNHPLDSSQFLLFLPFFLSPSLGLLSAISPLFHHHDPSSFPSSSSYFWSLSTIFHALAASGRWTVQLAYSRDQSGGTRATRINDHQRDDSFFAECARDKSRFRCLRRHHAAHAYSPLLVCPRARGGALYRLFSDPFRE